MSTSVVLPVNTYPVGQRLIGPVSVPDNIATVTFAIQRCTSAGPTIFADPASSIDLLWDASVDGAPFQQIGGFSTIGGIVSGKSGGELQFSDGSISFPPGINRRVQVHMTIGGSPVKTSVNLTTT